jgi:sterol desaturase/sphingolipid hydroxylase (fatty acid hydroxylase superfamily)
MHSAPSSPPPAPPPPRQAYDTWFFFVHRYAHINKWLFRHVHAMHHRNDAYLNVTSNSFEHPIDGLMVVGIPVGFVALLGCHIGNFWTLFVPMHTIACIFVFGERAGRVAHSNALAAAAEPHLI